MRTPTRRLAGFATAVTGLALTLGALAPPASAGVEQLDDLAICHRTNSNANPYVLITPDQSGQDGGADHFGEHTGPLWNPDLKASKVEWGDVIPPLGDRPASQAYQELGEGAEAFIANGCETEDVPTFDVTLDKVTTGGTAPAASTQFTFAVLCEPDTEATVVPVAPADEPALVGDDVAEDDVCTITETGTNGASGVTFQVTGGTIQSSTATSVTFSVEGVVSVVATNDYPAVQNTVVTQTPTTATPTTLAAAPTTLAAPAPVAAAAAPGGVQAAQLARTGSTNSALTLVSLGLVAAGTGTVLLARDRRVAVRS